MKYFSLVMISMFMFSAVQAQELNITVSIKRPELKQADPRVMVTLEREIADFFNRTQWGSDEFEEEERIEANLSITIKEEVSTTNFVADFVFQVIRPVYNSSYSTSLFNHIDKDVAISYQEHQPIQNNRDLYTDNLSTMLTFYAYVLIGIDYDSFSPFGGDEYFQIAKTIAENVPTTSGDIGWELSPTKRNRHRMIDNLLHPSMRPYRQAFYEYHRQALDLMTEDVLKSRAVLSGALSTINDVDKAYPNTVVIQIFCDAKAEEIVEIYKPSKPGEKLKIYNIMTKLDPAKSEKYFALKN